MARNLDNYFKEEKEISLYMVSIGKTADEKKTILGECWKDEEKQWNLPT